jgi:hypothetical protein
MNTTERLSMTFRDAINDEVEMYLSAVINQGGDVSEALELATAVLLGITSRVASKRVDRRRFINCCEKSWDIFIGKDDAR